MPNEMGRYAEQITFSFAASATASDVHNIQRFAAGLLLIPAEFNGDTLTIKTSHALDPGFTITAATGRYRFSSDELAGLFPMHNMQIVTNNATSAASQIVMLAKT
jgi:hypothetical protein